MCGVLPLTCGTGNGGRRRQVDVSSRTEGAVDSAYADGHGLPLLVKYDIRHQQNTEGPVSNIVAGVSQV